ncbi:ISC system 2Fe-2S type ferredoxin [soil metagenome]
MPKVTFMPMNKTVEAEEGQNLLEISEEFDIGLEHACGGVCACSTCHVTVLNGGDSALEEQEDDEIDTLDKLCASQTVHSRLGCQARVKRDVTVQIMNWPPREL